ncbi:MAG TPA: LLM class flavin-dependent oxidoreductase [Candidatus Acidoferrales bacterium]|nr:LLM class flavin-dependent oxidoreductase [Candidatus Acidoferrales bacterium]
MSIAVFSTCPAYTGTDPGAYKDSVRQISRWSEDAGCRGILIYTDNSTLDPWLVAQIVIESTGALSPLVAVQPVYMHPYSVAKMVATLSCLYGRRICLNMVAGGFRNDLLSLADSTPHDRRYDRLVEYSSVILKLLSGAGPVTFSGEFYRLENCALKPPLSAALFPLITISGSSAAGREAARALRAVAVEYPEPPENCGMREPGGAWGIRIGIIAREEENEAWRVAYQRFPPDKAGQITHKLAMKTSDSAWHGKLSALGQSPGNKTYWLTPFENYKTFCPYLVGDYAQVARELSSYISAGCETFILDVPASPIDLVHTGRVFAQAQNEALGAAAAWTGAAIVRA